MTDSKKDLPPSDMPEEISVGFTGDQRFPTYWSTSVMSNDTKYTRSDLCTRANTAAVEVWRQIETSPKNMDFIALAQNSSSGVHKCFIGHWESDGFYFSEGGELDGWNWTITHWMPLPMPPNVKIIAENTEKEGG